MLSATEAEHIYPYLEVHGLDEGGASGDIDEDDVPRLELSNGETIAGVDRAGEFYEYVLGYKLNELEQQLFESIQTLAEIGLLEITKDTSEFISIAPWHRRSV